MEYPNLRYGKAAVSKSSNSIAVLCVLVALLTLHRKMKADDHLLNSWKLCPGLIKSVLKGWKIIIHLANSKKTTFLARR